MSAPLSIGRLLRLSEAAEILGVSRGTMYRLLNRLEHYAIPCGGVEKTVVIIAEPDLLEFLKTYKRRPGRLNARKA